MENVSQRPEWAKNEFLSYASRFGVTECGLGSGSMVRKKTGGETIEQLRAMVSLATDEMRKERAATFFDNIKARSRMGQGIHDRLEAYVFADGDFSDYDIAGMNRHVPIPILFTCVERLTLEPGECLDLTADRELWGRGKGDDVLSIFNVHTLQMKKGSTIRVRGSLFVMLCQRLINEGGRLEILPTEFSYDKSFDGQMDGERGKDGADGSLSAPVAQLDMTATVFGRFYGGPFVGVQNGENGNNGADGERGCHGFCGGALKIAEINIRAVEGESFSVLIAGGRGGNGGDGGDGGRGSDGADGGRAYKSFSEKFPPGRGGNGGNGGSGGDGGRGGNGGTSSNIYIEVPDPQLLDLSVLPGYGGRGGNGGKGGAAGKGGVSYGKEGMNGSDGIRGTDGKPGQPGRTRKAAAVFVCGRRWYPGTENCMTKEKKI